MPLLRFELKNEYGLGDSRLYLGARKKEEDPRSILGGFTVSGLVGILRQLGDLAEFAAVVFNDVHQQVITTTTRGRKVLNRIRRIEAALPQFEKSVQEQKSHIHFAYITGCDWHANIQIAQSKLFGSDLPDFMMDSYEGCRDPPHLHNLDKFDSAGAGACLKRYSDPSYLWRAMANSESMMAGKVHNGMKAQGKMAQRKKAQGKMAQRKKAQGNMKQRLRGSNGLARHSAHMTLHSRSLNSSAQYASVVTGKLRFSVDNTSLSDSVSDFANEFTYFSSDNRSGCLEVPNAPLSMSKELYDEEEDLSSTESETKPYIDFISNNHCKVNASDNVIRDSMHLQNSAFSTSVSDDEKIKLVEYVNNRLSHGFLNDTLTSPKMAELNSTLTNSNFETDGFEKQTNLASRALIWDETATVAYDKCVFSEDSVSCDMRIVNIEPTSPRVSDRISPWSSPDLDRGQLSECVSSLDMRMVKTNAFGSKAQTKVEYETGQDILRLPHLNYDAMKCGVSSEDSDLLLLTPETSKQPCEMKDTEKLEFNEFTNHLDKHLNADSGLDLKFKTEFDYQSGRLMSLPRLNYAIECEVDKIVGVASPCIDEVGDDIIPFRPQGSDLYLASEVPNRRCELTCTERPNQEVSFVNKTKMVIPSLAGEIIKEHTSQIDEQITAAKALNSKVQANMEYQTGVMLFSYQKYDGMECKINKTTEVDIRGIDGAVGEIASESCTFSMKKTSMQAFHHLQPPGSDELFHKQPHLVEDAFCKNLSSGSNTDDDSEIINNNISCRPKQSFSQECFGDTSAKAACQKMILCENQTKHEVESADELNCRLTEYQISTEEVIASSELVDTIIETQVAHCSSLDGYTVASDMITCNAVDSVSSTFSSNVSFSKNSNLVFPRRNDSNDCDGNMSTQLTSTSVIFPSNVTATTDVEFQGYPIDSQRNISINIWTNGGLLGLEPSKPPDISVSNIHCNDQMYYDRSSADSQPCMLGNQSESRNSSFKEVKLNHVASFPEKDNITDSDIFKGGVYSENESDSNLSKNNRFPAKSPQRKLSNTGFSPFCEMKKDVDKLDGTTIINKHEKRPKIPTSSTPLHRLESKDVAHGSSEKLASSSLYPSGYQSPPIEHMKVSLQRMNNSAASKLKLDFCNICLPESKGNMMFPSFQLLSESLHPLIDDASESDDDSFCRSCPYSSDDLLALYSDSEDEVWGDDELDVSNRTEAACSISNPIGLLK